MVERNKNGSETNVAQHLQYLLVVSGQILLVNLSLSCSVSANFHLKKAFSQCYEAILADRHDSWK